MSSPRLRSHFRSLRDAGRRCIDALPPVSGVSLAIRVGLHWGPALEENGDVFGDTVNIAARMVALAKAGQILTTAEAAGGPTYRRFEQRQSFFLWLVRDVLQAALNRRALVDRRVDAKARIDVHGADLSARDNVALGMAANHIMAALTELRDRGLISCSARPGVSGRRVTIV